ncbi:MAG: uroporphyrinogen decarboxylase family protein [Promethearchaeia archaeon]
MFNDKQEDMFNRWLEPEEVEFVSSEAEKKYKERLTRIKDAIELKKTPDRVPICPIVSFFPSLNAGMTPHEVMYDYEKAAAAARKYMEDFKPDTNPGIIFTGSGPLWEILGLDQYAWPGHGVPEEHSYQCIEGEYMKPEEYDLLIQDPSHFWLSKLIPRACSKLEPLKKLAPPTMVQEMMYGAFLGPFGMGDVQEAYKTLFKAGEENARWMEHVNKFGGEMIAKGYPGMAGGFSKAPFDVLGDTLRGTRGIMTDIYRRPEKILEAVEVIVPILVQLGASMAQMAGNPIVFIPLHKGADSFLSDDQYKEFYWPTLKKVIMGLIEQGCIPYPFVEGSYNTRLEIIANDIPKGKTAWTFDRTDMAKAKEILGDVACIGGNVSTSLLVTGTPEKVKEKCKQLIDKCAKGGGYIMANGAALDEAKPENFKTMVEFTKEYGVYD